MVQLAWPLSPAGSLAVSMKLRQRLLHVMSTQVVHADDWIPGLLYLGPIQLRQHLWSTFGQAVLATQ